VASGLAASLAHPGGNVTGLTFISSGVAQKYVELLRDAVGSMARIAVLASRLQDPEIQADLRRRRERAASSCFHRRS
jgi:putative ABC transport system substrate-binding protein